MWYSGPWFKTSCPVRDFQAPRVSEVLAWFRHTHELSPTFGGAWWRLARLPRDGGLAVQEHWLMNALSAVRDELNGLLVEQAKERRKDAASKRRGEADAEDD